ncbi:unnamed protein product [Schistocephalus solidus]|uniref:Secreted protein n=1 Tax=Schistocephalus solidus TaxID=70667 RepID=A0A183TBV4_SCHSO|nr:unnamed protein product [Schistocephalus solidus]
MMVMSLSLHLQLLEYRCELRHQSGATTLVVLQRDCIGSRCFPAGKLLHGLDDFWYGRREIQVIVPFHFGEPIEGSVGYA